MTNSSSASSRSCCSRLMPALSPSFKSGKRSSLGTCSNTIGGSSVKERWRYRIMIRSLRSLSHQERKTIAGHRLQGIDDVLPEPSDPERRRALIVGSRRRCQPAPKVQFSSQDAFVLVSAGNEITCRRNCCFFSTNPTPGSTLAVDCMSFPNWATAVLKLTDPFITNKTGWLESETVLPYRISSRPLRNWRCLQG